MSNGLKVLAVSLFLLGIVVVFMGEEPAQSPADPALSFEEFDSLISAPVPMVSAVELAEYLMLQEHHYNLIDLQAGDAIYHIPTSESHSIQSFLERNVAVNETIFLYSESEATAVQLYLLLNIRGYFKVKVLAGGTEAWFDQILSPNKADIQTSQLIDRQNLTSFFGGAFDQTTSKPGFQNIVIEKQHKKHKGC